MPTNFVLRSPYLPANRSVFTLDAETPLAWFQSIWPRLRGDAGVTSEELLGAKDLYGFAGFAQRVREEELGAPATPKELQELLAQKWYSGNVECRDGYVLVETDDDEVELAFWWASDEAFQAEQERFACYAADALPLETGSGSFDPGFDVAAAGDAGGDGAVFGVFSTVWDSGNLSDAAGPVKVSRLRLPSLAAWLRTLAAGEDRLMEIDWLALVARHNPALDLPALLHRIAEASPHTLNKHWKAIRAGTLSEDELRKDAVWLGPRQPAGVQGGPHAVEFRLHDGFNWHVWFLFDDLWASAHPVLARSLLRFGMPVSG
jgi:hypothetical protein